MAMFHVYVEGPADRSPDGMQRLAAAIARSYGLPEADLAKRMRAGRFRVKANVDRRTADTYQRSLEELGARVTIEEAHPTMPVPAASPVPAPVEERRTGPTLPPVVLPPPRSKTPSLGEYSVTSTRTTPRSSASVPPANAARPATSSLPPANSARPSTPALPAAPARTSTPPPFASGLSAAYSQEAPIADLGALGGDSLALASLDGGEDKSPARFEPPSTGLPASIGPAPAPPAPAAKAAPRAAPLDLFAPPDAEEAEMKVDLAPEEIAHRERKLSTPPAAEPVAEPASPPLAPTVRRSVSPPVEGGVSAPRALEPARVRFAAGVLLSILLGFVPAHLIASARESSAFAEIDAQVHATQLQADSPEVYRQLDAFRAAQLSRKESEQRSIALASMVIWALAGAGLAYVWFRRVPWDRLAERS